MQSPLKPPAKEVSQKLKEATFEMALTELRRVSQRRRVTEPGAKLYELFAHGCSGTCEEPKPICGALGNVLTCCAMHALYEVNQIAVKIERDLRERIDRGNYELIPHRDKPAFDLDLADTYRRTFTGTGRFRAMREQFQKLDEQDEDRPKEQ